MTNRKLEYLAEVAKEERAAEFERRGKELDRLKAENEGLRRDRLKPLVACIECASTLLNEDEACRLCEARQQLDFLKAELAKGINCYDQCRVKLTPRGIKILRDSFAEFCQRVNQMTGKVWSDPPTRVADEDGYFEATFWEFFELFGNHFHIGAENPFDGPIQKVRRELPEPPKSARGEKQ